MSSLQFGTLKFIRTHAVTVEDLTVFNLTTFGSLVQHGWIVRKGSQILCSRTGEQAYEQYAHGGCNYRQHAGDISDRVRTLLHIGELQMMKQPQPPMAVAEKVG